MHISQISAYSNLYNNKTKKLNNRIQENKTNFKGYNEVFKTSMLVPIRDKKDAVYILKNLIKSASESFTLIPSFKNLFNANVNNNDMICTLLKKIDNNEAIAYDNSKKMAYAQTDSILFIGPHREESIEFRRKKNDSVEISRDDAYSSQIIRFYPNSDVIKNETKVSGSGLGQVSETQHYNPDGSPKPLRNLLNDFFGI